MWDKGMGGFFHMYGVWASSSYVALVVGPPDTRAEKLLFRTRNFNKIPIFYIYFVVFRSRRRALYAKK